MEAARTSETSVKFYQTTRHNNPEDSHLRTHRRENLKSYFYQCTRRTITEDSHPHTRRRQNLKSQLLTVNNLCSWWNTVEYLQRSRSPTLTESRNEVDVV
jgi:hypothetical protein